MQKRGKNASIFLIVNLVVAVIAFSYVAGLVSGEDDVVGAGALKETVTSSFFGSSPPVAVTPVPDAEAAALKALEERYGGPGSTFEEAAKIDTVKESSAAKGVGFKQGFKNIFGIDPTKTGGAAFGDVIISSAAWGLGAYAAIKIGGSLLGFDEKKVDAAALAAGLGVGIGRATFGYVTHSASGEFLGMSATQAGFVVGGVVAVGIFLLMYKDETTDTVTFQCLPWDAPIGGASCERCNDDPNKPCSEYRCRSLGQACQLLNVGTNEERCTWVNPKDVNPPVIEPWTTPLLDDYKYTPDKAISPPDRGVKVVNSKSTTQCVKPFTPLRFGITTDEPSQCKIDYKRPTAGDRKVTTSAYDAMQFFMGGSNSYRYNHTEILSLPGPSTSSGNATSPTLQNDGNYNLFVRCQDANGNQNIASFVFTFCVDKGPDTTPPLIAATSIINGMPVSYNQSSVKLDVYVNEPSSCRWATQDKPYKDMETTMQCSQNIFEMNAQLLYRCQTTLTGLKSKQDNSYFFRCADQPGKNDSDRNFNAESYQFTLKGTQPLDIVSVKPVNETIKDSTAVVPVSLEVETAHGFSEGKSICYYSRTGTTESYVSFFKTDSFEHQQTLNLVSGNYTYFVKCVDLGGNTDIKTTNFRVETDTGAPIVARTYHEETNLKIVTQEDARCTYSKTDCGFTFDDGLKMTTLKEREHYADWNGNTNYYIKCQDQYKNEPLPNQCSIVVRPFEVVGAN